MGYNYSALKTFTKSQINGLTKRLSSKRFGTGSNHNAWQAIFDDAESLGMEIGYCDSSYSGERIDFKTPRKITREQTAMGKAWLKNHFFKKNGEPRGGKATEYIGTRTLTIIQDVSRFEFVGVIVLASQGFYPCQVVPIYRTFNRKGQYFDYAPIHWAQPIVMEGN